MSRTRRAVRPSGWKSLNCRSRTHSPPQARTKPWCFGSPGRPRVSCTFFPVPAKERSCLFASFRFIAPLRLPRPSPPAAAAPPPASRLLGTAALRLLLLVGLAHVAEELVGVLELVEVGGEVLARGLGDAGLARGPEQLVHDARGEERLRRELALERLLLHDDEPGAHEGRVLPEEAALL